MRTNFFKRKDRLTTQDWKEVVETVHGKGEKVHDLIHLLEELETSYEERGKMAAIARLDTPVRALEIASLRQHLLIVIRKTIIHYEMQLNVLEHNIGLMAKEGNDESVDRLKVFRALNEKYLQNARELEIDALSGNGQTKRIDDTYNLGYQKGLITSMEFN